MNNSRMITDRTQSGESSCQVRSVCWPNIYFLLSSIFTQKSNHVSNNYFLIRLVSKVETQNTLWTKFGSELFEKQLSVVHMTTVSLFSGNYQCRTGGKNCNSLTVNESTDASRRNEKDYFLANMNKLSFRWKDLLAPK